MSTLKLAKLGNHTNLERIITILSWLETDNTCWICKRTKSAFYWGFTSVGYCSTCVVHQLHGDMNKAGFGSQENVESYRKKHSVIDFTCCLCGTGCATGQRWFFMPNQGEISREWTLWTHLHCFNELISDKQVKAHLLLMGY